MSLVQPPGAERKVSGELAFVGMDGSKVQLQSQVAAREWVGYSHRTQRSHTEPKGITRVATAQKSDKKPNILFIMGDDVGMWNISAYHRGMMGGRTPNIRL
jgi:hypothetical protein